MKRLGFSYQPREKGGGYPEDAAGTVLFAGTPKHDKAPIEPLPVDTVRAMLYLVLETLSGMPPPVPGSSEKKRAARIEIFGTLPWGTVQKRGALPKFSGDNGDQKRDDIRFLMEREQRHAELLKAAAEEFGIGDDELEVVTSGDKLRTDDEWVSYFSKGLIAAKDQKIWTRELPWPEIGQKPLHFFDAVRQLVPAHKTANIDFECLENLCYYVIIELLAIIRKFDKRIVLFHPERPEESKFIPLAKFLRTPDPLPESKERPPDEYVRLTSGVDGLRIVKGRLQSTESYRCRSQDIPGINILPADDVKIMREKLSAQQNPALQSLLDNYIEQMLVGILRLAFELKKHETAFVREYRNHLPAEVFDHSREVAFADLQVKNGGTLPEEQRFALIDAFDQLIIGPIKEMIKRRQERARGGSNGGAGSPQGGETNPPKAVGK